jgi:SAM-dependent methyltransferase
VVTARRFELLPRFGIEPTVQALVRIALDEAITRAAVAHAVSPGPGGPTNGHGTAKPSGVVALDAGCGRMSHLRPFRDRIDRLVGVDIHEPAQPLTHLDEFAIVDLCGPADGFPEASFDVVLSSFTLEHFADPPAALANIRRWLRPGGTLVATTVNRRHPFVAAYLALPAGPRSKVQGLVKASAADAHPLVGACNTPALIRRDFAAAGFESIDLQTVGHLARAWGRHLPTFALGLTGDLLAQSLPSRRSTVVVVARA